MRKSFDKKGENDYELKIRHKQDEYKLLCQQYVNQLVNANLAVKRFENDRGSKMKTLYIFNFNPMYEKTQFIRQKSRHGTVCRSKNTHTISHVHKARQTNGSNTASFSALHSRPYTLYENGGQSKSQKQIEFLHFFNRGSL